MTLEIMELYNTAYQYKTLYATGQCTREEAKEHIMPYIDAVNERGKELEKKYKVKYKPVSFVGFCR